MNRTASLFARLSVFVFILGANLKAQETKQKQILFLGDSLTAGYGLSEKRAYPHLLQQKLEQEGYAYKVINAGISGDTTAGGLRRLNWVLKQKVDILVLALGANDGLRGISTEVTFENLETIIQRTKKKYPDVKCLIAGMMIPPNLGTDYATKFREIFPKLSAQTDSSLIPFLLEGVAGQTDLNQPDGIHPTAKGQEILAANVWRHLKPMLLKTTPRE